MQSGVKKAMLTIYKGERFQYGEREYLPNVILSKFLCAECFAPLRLRMDFEGNDVFFCANDETHDGVILKSFLEASEQDARELEMERRERRMHDLMDVAERHYPDVRDFLEVRRRRDAELLYPREEA